LRIKSLFSGLATFFVGALFLAPLAHAIPVTTTTFDFTGQCSDCVSPATATLVLQDYTFGTDATFDNFVSFTFSGTSMIDPAQVFGLDPDFDTFSANLGSTPGSYNVDITGPMVDSEGDITFDTSSEGGWNVSNTYFNNPSDSGSTHTWNAEGGNIAATPEPGSIVLLGTGMLGIGGAIRRRFLGR
jgi:hypothetical protein